MAKGDDAISKKRNKAARKKMNNDPSMVSSRIASIIAAKKRRKSGKRSMCQGMCFSLPTPDNPFNDKREEDVSKIKGKRKEIKAEVQHLKRDKKLSKDLSGTGLTEGTFKKRVLMDGNSQERKRLKVGNEQTLIPTLTDNTRKKNSMKQEGYNLELQGCPSKFLILCLNSIQNAMRNDGALSSEDEKPLWFDSWGIEFWRCYSTGRNVFVASGACSTAVQTAWIVSSAADTITRKENEGVFFTSPFLLYLVPSKQKASKVRYVCKPLKAFGIHTVSLHNGASLDHQISGLRSCEPEFLVSTPDRLMELISLKAVDISGVSSLVVDGLESSYGGDYLDDVKSVLQHISGKPHTVVFNSGLTCASIPSVENLLSGSVCRLSLNGSIASEGSCIIQSVHVCGSEEGKLRKSVEVFYEACSNQPVQPGPSRLMFIVGKDGTFEELTSAIKSKGYAISMVAFSHSSENENSENKPTVTVMDSEQVVDADISNFEVIIISKFELTIDKYKQILSRMARHTVTGKLYSLLTAEDATFAAPLIEVLEECKQAVPEALKQMCTSTSS